MHLGNCWRPATAADLVKNCRKTCVCKCCSPIPPVPPTATHSKTTTAKNARTTGEKTTATILYTTTTGRQTTAVTNFYSTSTATVLYSTSTEEGKTKTGTKGTFVNSSVLCKSGFTLTRCSQSGIGAFLADHMKIITTCSLRNCPRVWHRLHVFPRLVHFVCFPVRGAACTFPALVTGCMFSRA